jgi:hypothetical protein
LHWDFADAGWDATETKAFILANKNLFNSWMPPSEWVKDADRAIHFEVKGKAGALRLKGDRISIYPKPPEAKKPEAVAVVAKPAPEPRKKHKHFQHLGYGMNMSGNAEHFVYDTERRRYTYFRPRKCRKITSCRLRLSTTGRIVTQIKTALTGTRRPIALLIARFAKVYTITIRSGAVAHGWTRSAS